MFDWYLFRVLAQEIEQLGVELELALTLRDTGSLHRLQQASKQERISGARQGSLTPDQRPTYQWALLLDDS